MMAAMSGRARSERDLPVRRAAEPAPAPRSDPAPRPEGPTVVDLTLAVGQAQKGDEGAFRRVYQTVQPGLLRYLRGLVGEEAEDVASETWSQIARDLGSFHGDGDGFRGWAATIARHRALDHLRQQRRRPVSAASVDQLTELAARDDTAARAIDTVSTDAAIALIASLPREQAEAVLLRVVMGLDVATVSRVLGKRPGAVRTATHRGLRRLAEHLERPSDAGQGGGHDASR
jgi:RNA polymerase sigma-70 factor (ECF subfamily)